MTDSFIKYVFAFLAFMYLFACVAEVWAVKDGVAAVFESVEKTVPHLLMFLLGCCFSKNRA